jgi:Na+/melibiose symporter-like transporter
MRTVSGRVTACLSGITGNQEERIMLKAIADVLRSIGGAIATVVTLPFRAVARLFGGASDSAHGHH